ncbi:hypothetical protein ACQEVG_27285 [Streptomyces sp. CA-135486]|uniref:hypothetical protein n=1 Tax=Streptomyces sp. CA-135486 TaxID=3240049 RepID=UPI003D937DC9
MLGVDRGRHQIRHLGQRARSPDAGSAASAARRDGGISDPAAAAPIAPVPSANRRRRDMSVAK